MATYRKSAVAFMVSFAIFADMTLYGIFIPLLPAIAPSRGISEGLLGLYLSTYSVGMVVSPAVAVLSDYWDNRKIPMVGGSLLAVMASIFLAAGSDKWSFLFARMFQGIAGCVSWMIGFSMLAEAYPKNLGAMMGVVMSANTIGNLVGPPIGGYLLDLYSMYAPLLFCVCLGSIDILSRLFVLPTALSLNYDKFEDEEETVLLPEVVPEGPNNTRSHVAELLVLLTNTEMNITLLAIIVGEIVLSSIEPTLPLYLVSEHKVTSSTVGLIWTSITIPKMIACSLAGAWSDTYGRKNITIIGLLIFSISCLCLFYSQSLEMMIVSLVIFGIGGGFALTPGVAEMGDIARKQEIVAYGTVYSMYNIATSTGMMLGPIMGSFAYSKYGFQVQSLISCAILALGFGIMLLYQTFKSP